MFFTKKELECKCCGVDGTDIDFRMKLNQLREAYGKPMIVNSAYRCPKHNEEVGGVKNSYHTQGIACDIKDTTKAFRKLAFEMGWSVGAYKSFTHCDLRENQIKFKGKY